MRAGDEIGKSVSPSENFQLYDIIWELNKHPCAHA